MPTAQEKKFQRPQSPAEMRRTFINKTVDANGIVNDDEIKAAGQNGLIWAASSQSLSEDDDFFRRNGISIIRVKHKGVFVKQGLSNTSYTYEFRKKKDDKEKSAIGQLAADLVRGAETFRDGVQYTQRMILDMLKDSARCPQKKDAAYLAIKRLESYFAKAHRHCAIDSGTTCEQAAVRLADSGRGLTPDPTSNLKELTIITNSPKIATLLEHPEISVEVIMLGGRLRKLTAAFAGDLTQQCISDMCPRFDLSLIGTTSLVQLRKTVGGNDHHEYLGFFCDSLEESRVKSILLERASLLKIVLMDASKCAEERSSAYSFAALSREHVDMVITDSRITQNVAGKRCLDEMWKQKIAVLMVDPSHTTLQ